MNGSALGFQALTLDQFYSKNVPKPKTKLIVRLLLHMVLPEHELLLQLQALRRISPIVNRRCGWYKLSLIFIHNICFQSFVNIRKTLTNRMSRELSDANRLHSDGSRTRRDCKRANRQVTCW